MAKKDLALMAMQYGHVYVAQVAFGAKDSQTVAAFREAEAYNGPALIIAYSHCIAHGFPLHLGAEQQKLAVESGFWPLFRYDPRLAGTGEPLQARLRRRPRATWTGSRRTRPASACSRTSRRRGRPNWPRARRRRCASATPSTSASRARPTRRQRRSATRPAPGRARRDAGNPNPSADPARP